MNNYEHFTAIVAGDNPFEKMEQHISKPPVEKVVLYKKEDAGYLKKQHLEVAKQYYDNTKDEYERYELEDIILTLENQTDAEFFADLSEDKELDENGNIIGYPEEEGFFSSYNLGRNLSLPFTLKNGDIVFQAKKGDVDWDKMHLNDFQIYFRTWELAVEGDEPLNDVERKVKENMQNRSEYFAFFKDKDTYAAHCSAFWGYAFLNENGEWNELTFDKNQIDWVLNYYNTFIKPLSDDTLLTIFECRK